MAVDIHFTAFFDATPSPYLVLDTDLVIHYANPAFMQSTGLTRDELIGKNFFAALPENPGAPAEDAEHNLKTSLLQVLTTGKAETLVLQRYDVPAAEQPGGFEERWWTDIHTPISGPDGEVKWIIQQAEDVTAFVHSRRARELI